MATIERENEMEKKINETLRQWEAGRIDDATCETILLQLGCEADLVATLIRQGR